jgi:hypothetical protein
VKADAYLYASEGRPSKEIDKLRKIERFGLKAITGREVFFHHELRRMVCAENIVIAYRDRSRASNWATWANENHALANILLEAEKIVNG